LIKVRGIVNPFATEAVRYILKKDCTLPLDIDIEGFEGMGILQDRCKLL
jgi:hypothetical protein